MLMHPQPKLLFMRWGLVKQGILHFFFGSATLFPNCHGCLDFLFSNKHCLGFIIDQESSDNIHQSDVSSVKNESTNASR